MAKYDSVIAVFQTHSEAERAVKELQRTGLDMRSVSIVGKDYHTDEQVVGYYNAGDRMKRWGKTGAFWGGFWGLLFGSAFFAIPGLGQNPRPPVPLGRRYRRQNNLADVRYDGRILRAVRKSGILSPQDG